MDDASDPTTHVETATSTEVGLTKAANKVKFAIAKEDFIAQNLARQPGEPPYTLRQIAEVYNISYNYLRIIAAKEKWSTELEARLEDKKRQAGERIQRQAVLDEIEIRTRQATYARFASELAIRRLKLLDGKDIKQLSVRNAIELLKVGLAEERNVVMVGEPIQPPLEGDAGPGLTDDQVFAVAARIIETHQNPSGVYEETDE